MADRLQHRVTIRAVEVAFKKPRFLGFLKKPKKPQKSKF